MQPWLFDPTADRSTDEQPIQREIPKQPKTIGRHERPSTEPVQTLFGIVETKSQARERAQEISRLLATIEDAPSALECCNGHIESLEYFIRRSDQIALDPNDRDGLMRAVGDLEEVLTKTDCEAMLGNPAIWRPYPPRWIAARPGETYAAALHPKEIAYLREMQQEQREEIEAIELAVPDALAALERLRTVGPLPEDVAQKYGLTPEGNRIKRK